MNLVGEQKCDICGDMPDEIIDGRTMSGQWAWMCKRCWVTHGMYETLGLGKGQKFENKKGGEKLEG